MICTGQCRVPSVSIVWKASYTALSAYITRRRKHDRRSGLEDRYAHDDRTGSPV